MMQTGYKAALNSSYVETNGFKARRVFYESTKEQTMEKEA